jgi:small nuclear ribonucleoprotein (snRNP)-like protein
MFRGFILFPNDKVKGLIGSKVQIEMKGEKCTLEGILEIVDDYLNLHLTNTTEIVDGERARALGSVLVRGNNIILVNPVNE